MDGLRSLLGWWPWREAAVGAQTPESGLCARSAVAGACGHALLPRRRGDWWARGLFFPTKALLPAILSCYHRRISRPKTSSSLFPSKSLRALEPPPQRIPSQSTESSTPLASCSTIASPYLPSNRYPYRRRCPPQTTPHHDSHVFSTEAIAFSSSSSSQCLRLYRRVSPPPQLEMLKIRPVVPEEEI